MAKLVDSQVTWQIASRNQFFIDFYKDSGGSGFCFSSRESGNDVSATTDVGEIEVLSGQEQKKKDLLMLLLG